MESQTLKRLLKKWVKPLIFRECQEKSWHFCLIFRHCKNGQIMLKLPYTTLLVVLSTLNKDQYFIPNIRKLSRYRQYDIVIFGYKIDNQERKKKKILLPKTIFVKQNFPESYLAYIIPTSSIIFISNVCTVHLDFT